MAEPVFALLLTGPPGAGKTDVLTALSDLLVADDVRHASIEAEALTSAHPALDGDQWTAPVLAVCGLRAELPVDRKTAWSVLRRGPESQGEWGSLERPRTQGPVPGAR